MTAEHCIYWQGEGCILEALERVKCPFQTEDFVTQCNATDEMLNEVEDD